MMVDGDDSRPTIIVHLGVQQTLTRTRFTEQLAPGDSSEQSRSEARSLAEQPYVPGRHHRCHRHPKPTVVEPSSEQSSLLQLHKQALK